MLTESTRVFTEHTLWKKVKGSFDHDPRYKAVESSSKREELFKEHMKGVGSTQVCDEVLVLKSGH